MVWLLVLLFGICLLGNLSNPSYASHHAFLAEKSENKNRNSLKTGWFCIINHYQNSVFF
jgi:hypothetical protein